LVIGIWIICLKYHVDVGHNYIAGSKKENNAHKDNHDDNDNLQ